MNKKKNRFYSFLVGGRYMVSLCVSLGVSNIIMPAQKRLAGVSKQLRPEVETFRKLDLVDKSVFTADFLEAP